MLGISCCQYILNFTQFRIELKLSILPIHEHQNNIMYNLYQVQHTILHQIRTYNENAGLMVSTSTAVDVSNLSKLISPLKLAEVQQNVFTDPQEL